MPHSTTFGGPIPWRVQALDGRAAIIPETPWWPEQPIRIAGFDRDLSGDIVVQTCLIRHDGNPDMQLVPLEDVLIPLV